LQDLALEAPQCALDGFPILNVNLSQRTTPNPNFSTLSDPASIREPGARETREP
jgi:hypothetical protein